MDWVWLGVWLGVWAETRQVQADEMLIGELLHIETYPGCPAVAVSTDVVYVSQYGSTASSD
jgi:hypothetical protein